MLKGLRHRLTYANVMSTIAVVVALGGGYAMAVVSGKGSIQKAGIDGLSTSFKKVRSLAGFGTIQARCDTADNTVEVRFRSSKGGPWHVFGESNNDQLVNLSVSPGETDNTIDVAGPNAYEYFDLHISKMAADNPAQAHVMLVGAGPPFDDNCATSHLRVLVVNTQR